jgi:hypothetical protein
MCQLVYAKYAECGHKHNFITCCPENAPPGRFGGPPKYHPKKCPNVDKTDEDREGLCPGCTWLKSRGKDLSKPPGFFSSIRRSTPETWKVYLCDGDMSVGTFGAER